MQANFFSTAAFGYACIVGLVGVMASIVAAIWYERNKNRTAARLRAQNRRPANVHETIAPSETTAENADENEESFDAAKPPPIGRKKAAKLAQKEERRQQNEWLEAQRENQRARQEALWEQSQKARAAALQKQAAADVREARDRQKQQAVRQAMLEARAAKKAALRDALRLHAACQLADVQREVTALRNVPLEDVREMLQELLQTNEVCGWWHAEEEVFIATPPEKMAAFVEWLAAAEGKTSFAAAAARYFSL